MAIALSTGDWGVEEAVRGSMCASGRERGPSCIYARLLRGSMTSAVSPTRAHGNHFLSPRFQGGSPLYSPAMAPLSKVVPTRLPLPPVSALGLVYPPPPRFSLFSTVHDDDPPFLRRAHGLPRPRWPRRRP